MHAPRSSRSACLVLLALSLACREDGSASTAGEDGSGSATASSTGGDGTASGSATDPLPDDSADSTAGTADADDDDDDSVDDDGDSGDDSGDDDDSGTGGESFEACYCFDATTTRPIVGDARDVRIADLDDDGNLDLAVIGRTTNTVQLHFGDGDGDFSTVDLPADLPTALAIGDVDGDGDLDLVLVEGSSLGAWLNDGNGDFVAAGTPASVSSPSSQLELGDFDGDGNLDAVSGSYATYHVARMALGDGMGSFTTSSSLALDYQPTDLQVADVDGDGDLDVAIRDSNTHALIAFGDGSGELGPQQVRGYAGPDRYDGGARLGDVDEDGVLDWVMLGRDRSWLRRGTGVSSGVGTGFAPAELIRTTGTAAALRLVDLDGDDHLDILAIIDDEVVYALGDGDGGWTGTAIAATGVYGIGLAHGDLDHDGALDVVTLDADVDQAVIVWGASDRTVAACASVCGGGSCGDGQVDQLEESCDGEPGCTACAWDVDPGCGDRTVTPGEICYAEADVVPAANDWEVHGIDGDDLDGDGRGDLLLGMRDNQFPSYDNSYWGVYWDLGEGAIQWSNHSGYMSNNYSWQCRSDPRVTITQLNANADSVPDFIIACHNPGIASALVRALGDGNTGFSGMTEAHEDFHSPMDAAMGDFDEDGDLDVVTASAYAGGHFGFNTGNGTFPAAVGFDVGTDSRRVGAGDADGDNDLDVFMLRENGTLRVMFGDGAGGITGYVDISTDMDELVVVDIDDDGDLDVVGSGSTTDGSIETALNDGAGNFTVQGPYPAGLGATTSVAVLEANADGVLDVVATGSNGISVVPGLGDGSFGEAVEILSTSGVRDTYVEDVDGDGLDDIFATLSNAGDGSLLFLRSDP